ncbi:MAG: Abi family protein [Lachnospiraceae bacterium]|nr:Abi family protein [Lachnospiraceae bacterium]
MQKTKLTVDEQIVDLKNKGVKFELVSEEEAKKFLRYNNFYFKLKSYAQNYEQYQRPDMKGKYINLDFAYLVELSKLDMHFRKLIVEMCLDIEHFLKARLMYDVSNNPEEDGYNIVNRYLEGNYNILHDLYRDADKSATSNLVHKFKENESEIPIWKIIETLSFGKFIELYNLYYGTYGGKNYSGFLGSIKFLRNAAAHNTCLLNSIRRPYKTKINKTMEIMGILSKLKEMPTSYKSKMQNPVIHDFVVMLFVYNDILNYPANRDLRSEGMEKVHKLFKETFVRKKEWFEKNVVLKENYDFICLVLKHLENLRNGRVI